MFKKIKDYFEKWHLKKKKKNSQSDREESRGAGLKLNLLTSLWVFEVAALVVSVFSPFTPPKKKT